jgi:hypothetical protein
MAFITDIEDALLTVLNQELTIPVIIAHENAPEPVGDYGVIAFVTADKKHRNALHFYKTLEGFEESVQQTFLLRFNLKFYGDSCHDNAFLSQAVLASSDIQDELYHFSHLSYADVDSVQNNPEFRPTGFIKRSVYDATFLSGFEYKRTIDWFDTVSYEGEYIDHNGNIVLTTSATVSASDT